MFLWDDRTIAAATAGWRDGKSASIVAAEIGAPSRSAVIGKWHRLGLVKRSTIPQRNLRKKRTVINRGAVGNTSNKNVHIDREERALRVKLAQEAREKARNLPDLEPLTRFVDLEANACRWFPAGQEGFQGMCCGRPTKLGLSFCDHHHARAWDAVKPRKDDPAPVVLRKMVFA